MRGPSIALTQTGLLGVGRQSAEGHMNPLNRQHLHIRVQLLVLGVNACARCVEKAFDFVLTRRLDHVERDHRVVEQDARVV